MADPDSGDLLLVAAKDESAFYRLLSRWRTPVYALFERSREPSAATEAAGDVFLELRQTAPRYSPGVPFPVFLFGIAHRRMLDEPAEAAISLPRTRLTESASARTALLRSAIAALPPGERSAFLLTRIARLSVADAAKASGVSDGELKKRIVRAMESLRRTLAPLLELVPEGPTDGQSTTILRTEGAGR